MMTLGRKDFNKKRLLISVALLLVCMLVSARFAVLPMLGLLADLVILVALIACIVFSYKTYQDWQNSKYDLSKLFDEESEPDDIDVEDHTESLFCPSCGIGYPSDRPSCPECGRPNRRHL